MPSCLPINIDDLLHFRGVESPRVELKASWNDQHTLGQVLETICAFANDFYNVNGGYVVIGVEEQDGVV
ncbi:MAG TPA: ATP-binding protein [Candidatus Nanopelagicales bacterium]|nr:ATP-binding protein [Candidatus Nanopelagicales bacterium]